MKILGREPAVILTFAQAIIVLFGQHFFDWSTGQTALVYAVLVAVMDTYVAYKTSRTLFAVAMGLGKALIAAYIGFGGDLSPEATAQLLGALSATLGLFHQSQVSPVSGNFDLAA